MALRDMVARHTEFSETHDYIPTPPWATRALFEYVAPWMLSGNQYRTVWDPAAGQGHMLQVFREYDYQHVVGTDIHGVPEKSIHTTDFTNLPPNQVHGVDDIITNPPYSLIGDFIENGLACSNRYLALLVRVQALEGQRRYQRVFKDNPPTLIGFFSDRISFKIGKVVQKAPKMYFHMWLLWDKVQTVRLPPMWIPPNAQQMLERDSDYA